jgi:hypothetical protein
MKPLILLTAVMVVISSPTKAQVHDSTHKKHQRLDTSASVFEIPGSLQAEHKELHEMLEKFTRMTGKTGAAAKEVAHILHPHFVKEEQYALPPLGLLTAMAKGESTTHLQEAIDMADKLKQEWEQMLAEHKQISASLETLQKAAREERHPEVVRFTKSLNLHAKTEEEVLYPTAILIGEYLKLKQK